MNEWLWAAAALTAALPFLVVAALRGPRLEGVVALEAASADAALVLLLIAEGTRRQLIASVALVLAVMSFAGSLVYLRFLDADDA